MIKQQYLKETVISGSQSRDSDTNNKKDVMKIQSWLSLYALVNPSASTSTGIDGDFGPATELAVKNYQKAIGVTQNGVVSTRLFQSLCQPMTNAFETEVEGEDLRTLIVNTAHQHLESHPFELVIKGQANSGPWVRSYMDGNEGEPWYWCMGFVQTIIDQAASIQGKDYRQLMPLTYSCDTVGTTGLNKGLLSRYTKVRSNPSVVKPGDIFLVQKSSNDWIHTGIIVNVRDQVFETIEGNTNTDGSANGNGVYKRVRNFMQSKLDVFSIEPLV